MRQIFVSTILCLDFTFSAIAGQNAAPSSHMVYNDASFDGDILINEVRVPEGGEAKFTYYEALGWSGRAAGYAGIQAHPKAHNYIFSIWDHKEHSAPIKAVYRGPGTLTEKFGGEGTGLKSWNFELGWETDVWYTLVARCWPVGDHTYYGYWVRSDSTKQWTHMVTMDVAAKEAWLRGGNDSFIEDWLETGKNPRTTHLRNGWKRRPGGAWHAFGSGKYSVNSWDLTAGKRSFNFRTNWDGGVAEDDTGKFYFMTSGGRDTQPTCANPSDHSIGRVETEPAYVPIEINAAKAIFEGENKVVITWETNPRTLPQFSYEITAHTNPEAAGAPFASIGKIEPHGRTAHLDLPDGTGKEGLRMELTCRDILGNKSRPIPLQVSDE